VETVNASVTVLDGMMVWCCSHAFSWKVQLPSKTPLILDVFSHLVVRFTTNRQWTILRRVLLESLVMQVKKEVTGGSKQAEDYKRKLKILSHMWVSLKVKPLCFHKFFRDAWLTHAHTTSVCHKLSDVKLCCHNGCGSQCEERMSYWISGRMCVVSSDVSSISDFVYRVFQEE
jgi:hypothetical protein